MAVFLLLLLLLASVSASTAETDADLLLKLKQELSGGQENLLLSTWNASVPLCNWRGVRFQRGNNVPLDCSATSIRNNLTLHSDPAIFVSSIELSGAGLQGTIPADLARLSELRSLYLNVNSLSGSVPLELGNSPSVANLSLGGNRLNGSIPPSLWNLCTNLAELSLDHNAFVGSIPDPPLPDTRCPNLQSLDLSSNNLSGPVPEFLAQFGNLTRLDLSNNSLSGPIPAALGNLTKLLQLNLADNNLTGDVPSSLRNFGAAAFSGNAASLSVNGSADSGGSGGSGGHRRLSPGAVAGIVIALMAATVTAVSVMIVVATARDRRSGFEAAEFEAEETAEGRLVLFEGGEHLTVEDVLNATGQVLGKTSYGTVYRAKLASGGAIVLRLLREGSAAAAQSGEAFRAAVAQLGRIRHDNLVALRALYEGARGEKLLAYDVAGRCSLADALHGVGGAAGSPPLSWPRRHRIALGAARGLAHLHTAAQEDPVVHGNLKSTNVILDDGGATRLADYGLVKLMSPGAAADMVAAAAAEGYAAPELRGPGRVAPRTDVYSLGIVLLELLLGRRPGQTDLPALVKAAVLEERVVQVFDPEVLRTARSPAEDGLLAALQLAMGCCAPNPAARPDIKEVVRQLEDMRPRMHSPLYTPRSAILD